MWDAIKDGIFWVLEQFYGFLGDWGLAILLITLLFRALIYPITRKQFKSSFKMQKLQPQINALKEKYPGDQAAQQQEMMAIYKEAKYNPLSMCLPMLLQMPIFMALYQTLNELRDRSGAESATDVHFLGIIPDLSLSPGAVFGESGILAAIPYIALILLFGGSIVVPALLNRTATQQKSQLYMMLGMGALMMWFGWGAPAGVLLYWDVSSIIGVIQQAASKWYYTKKDALDASTVIDIKPVDVQVVRKDKKARPKKKK